MIIHLIHHPVSAKRFVEPLVKSLNANGFKAVLWLENKIELSGFIDSIDCPKEYARFDLSFNPLTTLIRLAQLINKLRKSKPTAIHVHQSRAALIPLVASKIVKIPIRIYHNHGTPYLGYKGLLRFLLRLLEVINCRLATGVLVVSKSIRDNMIQDGIVAEAKCQILGKGSICGIDLNEFAEEKFNQTSKINCREKLGINRDAYVVFYIGRPFRRKGIHTLLKSWQIMEKSNRNNILLIAGCSADEIEKAVGFMPDNIIAMGYTTDILECFAACDVVVLPSHHEGFPYSLLEGAAAARALVGTNIPGINSIIKNSQNGLLVPVENPAELAKILSNLRDNPDLRKKMGQAGQQYIRQYFDRSFCLEQLLGYYNTTDITSSSPVIELKASKTKSRY